MLTKANGNVIKQTVRRILIKFPILYRISIILWRILHINRIIARLDFLEQIVEKQRIQLEKLQMINSRYYIENELSQDEKEIFGILCEGDK